MRKIRFLWPFLGILFAISCGDGIGLGSIPAPENKFIDGEWEWVTYKMEFLFDSETKEITTIITEEITHYKKISFTENTFTFYEKTNYDHLKSEETYTGTYTLSGENTSETITFVSNEQKMNGASRYSFLPIIDNHTHEQLYPDNSVWFFNNDFPIGGIFTPVAP